MVGIGGAVWFVPSVRTVREDEVEARLDVEEECKRKPERRLAAFWSSLSFSLVVEEDTEMIERRFVMLESLFLPSASLLPFSLSSSQDEEERGDFGIGGTGTPAPMVPRDMVDGVDEEGGESEGVSES